MFKIYSDLWTSVARIRGVGSVHLCEANLDGTSWFNSEGYGGVPGGPELVIHNPDLDAPSEEPVDDAHVLTKLIKLSHEAGHATSWSTNAGDAWDKYRAAIDHCFGIENRVKRAFSPETPLAVYKRAIVDAWTPS